MPHFLLIREQREKISFNKRAETREKQIDGEDAKTWLLTLLLRREALAVKTIIEKVSKQQSDMMFR
jgi:hypothetical protein